MTQAAMEPAQALIGRDRELDLLEGLLAGAAAGEARFALVSGRNGTGKTALLGELGRRAASAGWTVLHGRSSEFEHTVPFGLLVAAFDAHLASLDPRTWDRVAPDDLGELATIFPSLKRLGATPSSPETPGERYRAHRAFVELVERLAGPKPMLIALDDLQWADDASREYLAYLVRRPPEAAVMVVGAERDVSPDGPFARVAGEATAPTRVERVALAPLADEAAVRPEGRLQEVSGAALDLARAAAVLGDPFALATAGEVAELDARAMTRAIEELAEPGLVRMLPGGARYEFSHPVVRSAIYAGCPSDLRMAAHERAAAALAARGAPAAERAHHVEHAARRGDPVALTVVQEAGLATAARAPAIAAGWFATALDALPPDAPADNVLELILARGRSQVAVGNLEEARTGLLEGLGRVATHDARRHLRLISACAGAEQLLGRHEEASDRLRSALTELPFDDARTAAELMIELSLSAFHRRDYQGMWDWASGALERSGACDDGALTATAAAVTALAATCTGDMGQAMEHRDIAIRVLDRLSDADIMARPHGLRWLSTVDLFVERFADGIKHARHGLELARAGGKGDVMPGFAQSLGNLLVATGCLEDARGHVESAVEAMRLTGSPPGLAWNLANRAHLATVHGDIESALRDGEEAARIAQSLEGTHVATRAATMLGEAALEAGDGPRSAKLLAEGAGGEEMELLPAARRAAALEALTRARLLAGDADGAARAAAASSAAAADCGLRLGLAVADRAAASVALRRGENGEAADRALQAQAAAREVGAPIDAALAQALAGTALARLGDTARAIVQLEEAAETFAGCGATGRHDRVEEELRKLGGGGPRRDRTAGAGGLASLTGCEYEVTRLVADGRTNPEIAAELFLSVKAVERHLRNVYGKLGASSRAEVERAVEASKPD